MFRSLELILKDANKKNGKEKTIELNKLKQELELHQKRLANAQLLMLDGNLDVGDYRVIKNRLEPEIERLQRLIAQWQEKDPEEDKILEYGFFFCPL